MDEQNVTPVTPEKQALKLNHEFREGDGKEWPFYIVDDQDGRLRARVVSYARVSQGEAESLADLIVAAPVLRDGVAKAQEILSRWIVPSLAGKDGESLAELLAVLLDPALIKAVAA